MRTILWVVDFDNGMSIIVNASTVLVAVKNAIWGYNKNALPKMTPKRIIKIVPFEED